jgi:hypothetical protein
MRKGTLLLLGVLAVGVAAGWSLARTQEPPNPKPAAVPAEPAKETVPETPLDVLDWLVGDWVDASEKDDISVEFSCHFTKNNAFLVRSFKILNAKKSVNLTGMQLIAWDPAQKAIRSWTYDSNGGFGEETWAQSGNRYTIRAKYTLPDGGKGSNMQVVTFVDNNKFTWESVNREIDGAFQPDTDEITLVRKPADAAKGAK